jgi:hypothetical protein
MATFTDADPNGTVSDYSAVIAWGDGQSSGGTVAVNGSGFKVTGTHTYQNGGSYTATVTVNDLGGASDSAKTSVSAAGISGSGANLSPVVNSSPMLTLATFSDSDGNTSPTAYSATINWGDGSANSTGMVMGGGNFTVQAAHAYTQQGYYQATISLTDTDGAKATLYSNVNVTHATMTASVTTTSFGFLQFSGQVGTFTDNDLDTNTNHYSVQVGWGDGTTSTAGIAANGGAGNFQVVGAHGYASPGTYTITITLTDTDSSTATASGSLTISNGNGALVATAVSGLTATEGTAFSNLVLCTFTDSDGNTQASKYTATITWGDGTSNSSGTVSTHTGGGFQVAGSHTYAKEGTYTLSISMTDQDGASTSCGPSITTNEATITATSIAFSATAGQPFSNLQVATFTDADPAASMTDYTALINCVPLPKMIAAFLQ